MIAPRRWIFVCVGLLSINALVMVVLVTASSRSAPAVVPRYYERAVAWDQTMAEARLADELGWTLALSLSAHGATAKLVDRDGQPIAGAALTVRGFHRAQPARRVELSLITNAAGEAAGSAASLPAGWYELDVELAHGQVRYSVHRAVEQRDAPDVRASDLSSSLPAPAPLVRGADNTALVARQP